MLLCGERAFTLDLERDEKVIGEVEKGFELIPKTRNMQLHLKGDTLRNTEASHIFKMMQDRNSITHEAKQRKGFCLPHPHYRGDSGGLSCQWTHL